MPCGIRQNIWHSVSISDRLIDSRNIHMKGLPMAIFFRKIKINKYFYMIQGVLFNEDLHPSLFLKKWFFSCLLKVTCMLKLIHSVSDRFSVNSRTSSSSICLFFCCVKTVKICKARQIDIFTYICFSFFSTSWKKMLQNCYYF